MCLTAHVTGNSFKSWFSPSTMWFLGTELSVGGDKFLPCTTTASYLSLTGLFCLSFLELWREQEWEWLIKQGLEPHVLCWFVVASSLVLSVAQWLSIWWWLSLQREELRCKSPIERFPNYPLSFSYLSRFPVWISWQKWVTSWFLLASTIAGFLLTQTSLYWLERN